MDVNVKKLTFFSALCFFLSAVELAIPKPVPFFRLGLANLPVMLSLAYLNKKETSLLILLKVLLQGIVSGTLFSYIFVFSLAGSCASGFGMMLVYSIIKRTHISWIGISLTGGLLNNAAQLICAKYIMFGDSVKYIAPVLLSISFVSSLLLGIFACSFESKSNWLKHLDDASVSIQNSELPENTENLSKREKVLIVLRFLVSIYFLCLALYVPILACLYFIILLQLVFLKASKKKLHLFPSIVVVLSVTFFSLLSPYGKILFSIGSFNITQGALEAGLFRGGRLCAMVLVSRVILHDTNIIPGKFGGFCSKVMVLVGKFSDKKLEFKKGKIVEALDERLMEVWSEC